MNVGEFSEEWYLTRMLTTIGIMVMGLLMFMILLWVSIVMMHLRLSFCWRRWRWTSLSFFTQSGYGKVEWELWEAPKHSIVSEIRVLTSMRMPSWLMLDVKY
jgi:hypothetical protein